MIKAHMNKPHDNGSIPASADKNKTKQREKKKSIYQHEYKIPFVTSVLHYTRNKNHFIFCFLIDYFIGSFS